MTPSPVSLVPALLALTLSACASAPRPSVATQHLADRASAERGELHTKRLRPRFGDNGELVKSLREIFAAGSPGAQVAAILIDPFDGDIVIIGQEAGTTAVHRLIDSLDQHVPDSEPSIELVSLVHADAREVARSLQPVLRGNQHLSVDPHTNQILVSGDTEGRQTVKRLAAALDVARPTK